MRNFKRSPSRVTFSNFRNHWKGRSRSTALCRAGDQAGSYPVLIMIVSARSRVRVLKTSLTRDAGTPRKQTLFAYLRVAAKPAPARAVTAKSRRPMMDQSGVE